MHPYPAAMITILLGLLLGLAVQPGICTADFNDSGLIDGGIPEKKQSYTARHVTHLHDLYAPLFQLGSGAKVTRSTALTYIKALLNSQDKYTSTSTSTQLMSTVSASPITSTTSEFGPQNLPGSRNLLRVNPGGGKVMSTHGVQTY